MCFQGACPSEVALLATLETASFLSALLLFSFSDGFASNSTHVHGIQVAWWEMQTCSSSGVHTGPVPPSTVSAVAVAVAAPGAGIVLGLQGCEDVLQHLFVHPTVVLLLHHDFPLLKGVGSVDVNDCFS
jgi:hypothetical protein